MSASDPHHLTGGLMLPAFYSEAESAPIERIDICAPWQCSRCRKSCQLDATWLCGAPAIAVSKCCGACAWNESNADSEAEGAASVVPAAEVAPEGVEVMKQEVA